MSPVFARLERFGASQDVMLFSEGSYAWNLRELCLFF